jgi:hypothetical protein
MGWNDVGRSGGTDFLKLDPGAKVKVHILSEEPHSTWGIFNQAIQRGARVSEGFSQPGVDTKIKHAFVIWNLDAGQVQVWEVSNTTAAGIKNIHEQYGGSLADVDLMVTRVGSGLKTKYPIVPVPTKFDASCIEGVELPDLAALLKEDDEETINSIIAGIVPDGGASGEATGEAASAEETPTDETPSEEQAPVPAKPAPAKPAPAKPAPVKPAAAQTADPARAGLAVQVLAIFKAKPKYKDVKAREAAVKMVNKTKISFSQLNTEELKKLLVILKK